MIEGEKIMKTEDMIEDEKIMKTKDMIEGEIDEMLKSSSTLTAWVGAGEEEFDVLPEKNDQLFYFALGIKN